jgi:hypothetical protein
MVLLKTLLKLVSEDIDNATVNVDLEGEVADLLVSITGKRRVKQLKKIKSALVDYIEEVKKNEKVD